MAHIIQPTLSLAAAATSSLRMLVSLVAPNSVMSSASPVRALTASALRRVAVSEDGQAKPRVEDTLANGQYMWKLNPEPLSPVEPSADGDPMSNSSVGSPNSSVVVFTWRMAWSTLV